MTERIAFDAAPSETFEVDSDRRTISGMVIPWGRVGDNGVAKWRFEQDSLHWSETSRVKLNLHHDGTQGIAYAETLQSRADGLYGKFRVADVPEGDRALKLAKGKVLDGFSVEVDLVDGYEPDAGDRSVNLVKSGRLTGVALTGTPAFDDARADKVAAHRNNNTGERYKMDKYDGAGADTAEGGAEFSAQMSKLQEAVTESHANLTKELSESIGTSISEGVRAALESLPSPQEGPGSVRASRFHVGREEPVYTFSGQGHSLVRDAWYAERENDDDAAHRISKYRRQQDEMSKLAAAKQSFANTTDAAEIIPPGYRPDLYVPELAHGRQLIGGMSRGTISNATPFLVPVFDSATNAVSDHTEGTNPTDGTIVFGETTVSPSGKSGRFTLTREIVDSSNPSIDMIALNTMREHYNRLTEAEAYTALNTTTGVQEPAGADIDLADGTVSIPAVRNALALYPFTRHAAPTAGLYLSQEATAGFATAEDSTGRPLLPSVGAQNSAGVGNAATQGWFVDGLPATPSPAMTVATSNAGILGWNRSDVWVWESPLLTFRFEEKQGPANIEMALFGYFAVHVLRPAGVFKLTTSTGAA